MTTTAKNGGQAPDPQRADPQRADPQRTRAILKRDVLRPFFLEEGRDGALMMLDQRALPIEEKWLTLRSIEEVAQAIETLAVRGAPAIGGAAALAMAMLARQGASLDELRMADARLRRTRPTAVNLFFALDAVARAYLPKDEVAALGAGDKPRLRKEVDTARLRKEEGDDVARLRTASIVDAAERYVLDDEAACARMGEHGAALLADGDVVMTVCHTGALATCGQGTALGVIKSARAQGKDVRVVALETRPLLQGARLTAWECMRENIPCTLLTDGMSAFAMRRLRITKAIAGADRIARDGSTANKIGTYALAVVAKHHGVPFFIAAPWSTIDVRTATGDDIVIEERAPDEVRMARGLAQLAPSDARVWNPAFDVTPPSLITSFITERGALQPPFMISEVAR